jgi:hypothetical protein
LMTLTTQPFREDTSVHTNLPEMNVGWIGERLKLLLV